MTIKFNEHLLTSTKVFSNLNQKLKIWLGKLQISLRKYKVLSVKVVQLQQVMNLDLVGVQ